MVVLQVMLYEAKVSFNLQCNTFARHVVVKISRAIPLFINLFHNGKLTCEWHKKKISP